MSVQDNSEQDNVVLFSITLSHLVAVLIGTCSGYNLVNSYRL